MIYIADQEIDRFLLEDISLGDLTSRSLGLTQEIGVMRFIRRESGRVSGGRVAQKALEKLGLTVSVINPDGRDVSAQSVIIECRGEVQALHQGWKVAQNILEWCCGVAQSMNRLQQSAQAVSPSVKIACTRKSIPGTKLLSAISILDGGSILHRCGTAETVLLFANHRRFLPQPMNWVEVVKQLKQAAPEKKIVVEADNMEEMALAIEAQADIVQLDKFSPEEINHCLTLAKKVAPLTTLAAAGGINLHNIAEYAATGVPLIVTSAPYYSSPADIKVLLERQ